MGFSTLVDLWFNLLDEEVAMARFDLTDFEWSIIQPLLPDKPRAALPALMLHGSLAGRPDHQDPCLGRCRGIADAPQTHRRPGA